MRTVGESVPLHEAKEEMAMADVDIGKDMMATVWVFKLLFQVYFSQKTFTVLHQYLACSSLPSILDIRGKCTKGQCVALQRITSTLLGMYAQLEMGK